MKFFTLPCALLIVTVLLQDLRSAKSQTVDFNQTSGGVKVIECTESNAVGTALTAINGSPIANLTTTLASAIISICSAVEAYTNCLTSEVPQSTNTYDMLVDNTFDLSALSSLGNDLCAAATNAGDNRTSLLVSCFVADSAGADLLGTCAATLATTIQNGANLNSVTISCEAINTFIDCARDAAAAQASCSSSYVTDFLHDQLSLPTIAKCNPSGAIQLTSFVSVVIACLCMLFVISIF